MAKREDIHKILVIGSGPIVIGQGAEFDYAGTQACLVLKEEGYEVILVNSNPATYMTDSNIADKVYMEPLTLEYISKIIRKERPDGILPGLGGQTGLNLVAQLASKGILEECRCEILGSSIDTIEQAEDRLKFRTLCDSLNIPSLQSFVAEDIESALKYAHQLGYPVVVRPAFTLGGTGGGFAYHDEELIEIATLGLENSPTNQLLIETSVYGYKEIEFEVMRDAKNHSMVICDMENIDPVGIHTGDSMVVAPNITLSNETYQMLRNEALQLIEALQIAGGCNVQFALHPTTNEHYVIEVNPRVSRSSALASKATGYPIARVTALIAIGYDLDEIIISGQQAIHEPKVNYVVFKMARFPFDKFEMASRKLSTQMKATGEIMSIAKTFKEALLKGVRSLEVKACHIHDQQYDDISCDQLLIEMTIPDDLRLFKIAEAFRKGASIKQVQEATKITPWFLREIQEIIDFENIIKNNKNQFAVLIEAKQMGFSDAYIALLWQVQETEVYTLRKIHQIKPHYLQADGTTQVSRQAIPYFYSSYHPIKQPSILPTHKPKVIVLGSGPIRIGQGVEFDYSTVHAIVALKEMGYEAIVINNNPETVSTDYTISDKLYFEPLTIEDVMNIVDYEQPIGVIVQLGGQTAINLANELNNYGVQLLGTSLQGIENAENRDLFEQKLSMLEIPQPQGQAVTTIEDGLKVAQQIGYPVLVRPSYVLGGRGMQIVSSDQQLIKYLSHVSDMSQAQPVLVDHYIVGKEVEIDAICDGQTVLIPGIMEHIEKTGVHSGDSTSVYPSLHLSKEVKDVIVLYTTKLGLGLGIIGLFNIQFIVDSNNQVYVIEVNPRSSRTVPFLSKVTGFMIPKVATQIIMGKKLVDLGFQGELLEEIKDRIFVKVPTFSFEKIRGLDIVLGPEMKSTGEAIGYDTTFSKALYKGLQASNMKISNYGTIFLTISDQDKQEVLEIARGFYELGFNLIATRGTSIFLKKHGIRVKTIEKLNVDNDILQWIKSGHLKYIINTITITDEKNRTDGFMIRRLAVEHHVPVLTSLDTARVILEVLEEITIKVSTIH